MAGAHRDGISLEIVSTDWRQRSRLVAPSNRWEMAVMNPLSPALMTPMERRAALCAILALGLLRLRQRTYPQHSEPTGESSLHLPREQSGSPDANHRRLP